MFIDAERDATLEASRRENPAFMTRICEPFHDRAQAMCDTSRRITDAVVVHKEEAHT
jgi:hypothetical protein